MSKHTRRRFDDHEDLYEFEDVTVHLNHLTNLAETNLDETDETDEVWSTYNADGVRHGPAPRPPWVITSAAAIQVDLGVLKSGKEADVSLIRRTLGDESTLLAAKRYRSPDHRLFHRDAQYLEGRRERRSRERRAMATRTDFGRELIAGRWAEAEFAVLAQLWAAGAAVPYPVQLLGTELIMEFIGSPDGVAAPRLAQLRPDRDRLAALFEQLRDTLSRLALAGLAHGDLSAYNVLVDESAGDGGRVVVIDLPQAVDLIGNPRGPAFVRRDCDNICSWFTARGLAVDSSDLAEHLLWLAR